MFVDVVKVKVKAGDGGDGAVAFHREKYVAAGGPDGGDGGRGGDVLFVADDNLSTLVDFRYKSKYEAGRGEDGKGNNCYGKKGQDLVIRVPRGTLVKETESGRIVADISGDEPVVIAKGGNGGFGNSHFKSSTRQIPRFSKPGQKGQKFELTLELKLLADVCLVGFPSVGKSTLISVVSAAKPKIAAYHFTTLTPVLGVVRVDNEKSFVMADIPGLIEGASEGVGLGHDFLRHIERCRLIIHLVDVSGSEGRDPVEDFIAINKELANFSEDLAALPQIVAANKCDIAGHEQVESFRSYIGDQGYPFFAISAATASGTKELINEVAKALDALPPVKVYEPEAAPKAERKSTKDFTVTKEDGVYVVEAEWLEHILGSVNMDDYESLQYFQLKLRQSGIIAALEEKGIEEGDTVRIFDLEFEFIH